MKQAHNTTVDAAEIEKFSRQAGQWWDEHGPFAPLHRMNPIRIEYILKHAASVKGQRLLDIGCGGGLICEPFARLDAHVTGIDASKENIEAAKLHATQARLAIDYRCTTAEALVASGERFDMVLALEIIEHVADVEAFVAAASALVKPGGHIIFSTINRTAKSFALAIVGAEYLLRLVPRGTHEWEKFVKPHELAAALRRHSAEVTELTGMAYNPLNGEWRQTKDIRVNYLLAARK